MKPRLVSIGLFGLALVFMRYPEVRLPNGEPQKRLATFPAEFDGWKGEDHPFAPEVMKVANTDDDLHRLYKNGTDSVWLYIGYYGTRKGGRTGHLPHHCYPGAGYRILDLGTENLSLPDGQNVRVNRILTERNGTLSLALYWIQSGDQKVLTDGWDMNISRFRRRLTTGRDDGALVRISSIVYGTPAEELEREKKFAVEVLERISDHWPREGSAPQLASLASNQISGKTEKT